MSNSKITVLIERIRGCARDLPPAAHEIASMLMQYANKIESPATQEEALKEFDNFAWHWKGLRDLIVPGVKMENWDKSVRSMSRCARAAVRARSRHRGGNVG